MPTAGTTHHIVLDDGVNPTGLMAYGGGNATFSGWQRTPLQRSSLKTSTGEQKYSDLQPPYYTIAQENWEGGRGQEEYTDKTRFYDACNVWTRHKNQAILGPRQYMAVCNADRNVHYEDAYVGQHSVNMGEVTAATALGYAVQFTVGASNLTLTYITIFMCRVNSPENDVTIAIYSDNADAPNASVVSSGLHNYQVQRDVIGGARVAVASTTLTAATKYWLVVTVSRETGTGYYKISGTYGAAALKTINGTDWVSSGYDKADIWYLLNDGNASADQTINKFIEYKECLYAVTRQADWTAPGKLLRNGDRGTCDSNAGAKSTLIDATKSWTPDEWIGCVVKIIAGPGLLEWRTITDNDATTLTVSPDWSTTHTTESDYVILGSSKWTDVTPAAGDTIDRFVSDVIVTGDYLAIAQGVTQDILMYREYNNAGTWTVAAADQTNSYVAYLMCKHYHGKETRIYRIYASSGVWYVDWATSTTLLNFDADKKLTIPCTMPPTGMIVYQNVPYIFTGTEVYCIYEDALEKIDIDYSSMKDEHNGVNLEAFNMFIFYPLLFGLERTNGKQVDDIGPNRDAGMPPNRQGYVADMCATVDTLYYVINAGSGRSAVMAYNNFGHHEVARGIAAGMEMCALGYQVIPGGPNRLWYGEGNTIRFIKMPSKTTDPFLDTNIKPMRQGELVTSWIDIGLSIVSKFFHELTLLSENLTTADYIDAYYQTDTDDDASDWTFIAKFYVSPVQTESITSGDTLSGTRIRFKFVFHQTTDVIAQSDGMLIRYPKMKAWAMEAVARLDTKYSYAVQVQIADRVEQMDNSFDTTGANTILGRIDAWATTATPLTMTSVDEHGTGVKVFVEPMDYRIQKYEIGPDGDTTPVYLGTLKMIEA